MGPSINLKKTLMIGLIFGLLFGFDFLSKSHSELRLSKFSSSHDSNIYQAKKVDLIGSNFTRKSKWAVYAGLTYVRNKGMAFGALRGTSPTLRRAFFGLATIFSMIIWWMLLTKYGVLYRVRRYGLYLVLIGAFGNIYDRLFRGYVIDLIDLRWAFAGWNYSLPAFNLADVYIVVGILTFIFSLLLSDLNSLISKKNPNKS